MVLRLVGRRGRRLGGSGRVLLCCLLCLWSFAAGSGTAAITPAGLTKDLLGTDPIRRSDAALRLTTQDVLPTAAMLELADRLLAGTGDAASPATRSLAFSMRCRGLYRDAQRREGNAACAEALQLARTSADVAATLIAGRLAGQLRSEGGDRIGAALELRALIKVAEKHGDPYAQSVLWSTLAIAAENAGAFDEAAQHYARAQLFALSAADTGMRAVIASSLGTLYNRSGDPAGAMVQLREALRLADAAGHRSLRTSILTGIAEAELGLGHIAESQSQIEQVLSSLDPGIDQRFQSRAFQVAATAALAAGMPARAQRLALAGLTRARVAPFRRVELQISLAEALRALGKRTQALQVVRTAYDKASELRFESLTLDAARVQSDVLADLGRHREAYALISQQRAERAEQIGVRARERLDFIRASYEESLNDRELALSQARAMAAEATAGQAQARLQGLILASLAALFAIMLGWRLWAQRQARDLEERLTQQVEERSQQLQRQLEARQAMEAAMEQSRRLEAVGRLTGGIAHDFNNLMSVVQQATDLMRLDPRLRGDARLSGLLDDCSSAALAGAGISRQLVSFARQQPMRSQDLSIAELLQRARGLLQTSAGDMRRLEFDVETPAPVVRVDASQLTTALINLVANARDATTPGSRILVRVRKVLLDEPGGSAATLAPGCYVSVAVVDDGIGMSNEIQRHAAEPFFTTKEPGAGTGLGLSMVHGFATQSGGELHIATAEAAGTTATILLPAAA